MMPDIILGALPDPFVFDNGEKLKTKDEWTKRRKEILFKTIELEYGGMPPEPDETRLERLHTPLRGRRNSYRVHVLYNGREFSFLLHADIPEGEGNFPVLLTGDGCYNYIDDKAAEYAAKHGIMTVRFDRTELAPDIYNCDRNSGIYNLFPESHFSAISAWAWGYRRAVDIIPQIPFAAADEIAISGHSRGGKTVLLAGATDERIKYINPNGSGAHGCGCYRYEQCEDDGKRSEKLGDLFKAVPYWLGPDMEKYIGKETELPHDMHFIKALIAPRYLFETNSMDDIWANPKGSYLNFRAAKRVFDFLGCGNNIKTHYRKGIHYQTLEDITAFIDFMDFTRRGIPVQDVIPSGFNELKDIFDF